MNIPIPDTQKMTNEEVERWVKTITPDIKVTISEQDRTVSINYKPGKRENTSVYDNGKIMIVGYPPAHIYLRAVWYSDNGYCRILISPWL